MKGLGSNPRVEGIILTAISWKQSVTTIQMFKTMWPPVDSPHLKLAMANLRRLLLTKDDDLSLKNIFVEIE